MHERIVNMQMTIGSNARNGDKQIAGLDVARIGRNRLDDDIVSPMKFGCWKELPQTDSARSGGPGWHTCGASLPCSPK